MPAVNLRKRISPTGQWTRSQQVNGFYIHSSPPKGHYRLMADVEDNSTFYVHTCPPRVLQMNPSVIRQWLRGGEVDQLEQVVLEGQGHKLIGEYSPDPKVRAFLKEVPNYMTRIGELNDAVNKGSLKELQKLAPSEDEEVMKNVMMCKDHAGVGLLHKAVYNDQPEIVKWLLKKYPQTVSLKDRDGKTALHYVAVCADAQGMWNLLLQAGADPTVMDARGRTAAYYMERPGEIELPEPKLPSPAMKRFTSGKNGIVVKPSNIRIWIHDRDLGRLQQILWEGHGAKLRVETSNNPKVKRFLDGVPYIMNVIKDVHTAVIQGDFSQFTKKTSDPIPIDILTSKDANGLTPLHKAAGLGHIRIVEDIVERLPKSVFITDNEGRTPLHYAASARDGGSVYDCLIEHGADHMAFDQGGKLPSYYKANPRDIPQKLIETIPEAPRMSLTLPPSFDWSILRASAGSNFENRFLGQPISRKEDDVLGPRENDVSDGNIDIWRNDKYNEENGHNVKAVPLQSMLKAADRKEMLKEREEELRRVGGDSEKNQKEANVNKASVPEKADAITATAAEIDNQQKALEEQDAAEYEMVRQAKEIKEKAKDELKVKQAAAVALEAGIQAKAKEEREAMARQEELKKAEAAEKVREDERRMSEEKKKLEEKNAAAKKEADAKNREAEEKAKQEEDRERELGEERQRLLDEGILPLDEEEDDGNDEDPEAAQLVRSGEMEALANMVLEGEGRRLLNRRSKNSEIQNFLDNVPIYMGKIDAVHKAAREGELRSMQAALDRRRFAVAKDTSLKVTPLHVATLFGKTPIIKYLGGRFPESLRAVDKNGRTALHYAACIPDNGHYFNLLLNLGADRKIKDDAGNVPQYYVEHPGELTQEDLLKEISAPSQVAREILSDKVPNDKVSSRRHLQDKEILAMMDRCMEIVENAREKGSGMPLVTHLTKDRFDVVKDRITKHDHTLIDVIWPGVRALQDGDDDDSDVEESGGIVAPDFETYIVFEDLMMPMIRDMHCLGEQINLHPKTNFFQKKPQPELSEITNKANSDNGGIIAPDTESYEVYKEVMEPIVKDIHGLDPNAELGKHPRSDFYNKEKPFKLTRTQFLREKLRLKKAEEAKKNLEESTEKDKSLKNQKEKDVNVLVIEQGDTEVGEKEFIEDDGELFLEIMDLDPTNKYVLAAKVECSRNLEKFPLPKALREDELEMVEQKLLSALKYQSIVGSEKVIINGGEIQGFRRKNEKEDEKYYSAQDILTGPSGVRTKMAANDLLIPLEENPDGVHCKMIHGTLWPKHRGVFIASQGNMAAWINVQEHLRLVSCSRIDVPGNIGEAYGRMACLLSEMDKHLIPKRDDMLGFLTSRPSCLGNTLRLQVTVRLPRLPEETLEVMCDDNNLMVSKTNVGDKVYKIKNKQCLGMSEYETYDNFASTILAIVTAERSIAEEKSRHVSGMIKNIFTKTFTKEIPLFGTEEGKYLANALGEPLTQGLTEIAAKRPANPIAHLAHFLQEFAHRQNGVSSPVRDPVIRASTPPFAESEAPPLPAAEPRRRNSPKPGSSKDSDNLDSAFNATNRDEYGQSLLHFAASRAQGRNSLFQLINESGVNIGYRDELYRTARDVSVQANLPNNVREIDKFVLSLAARGETERLIELLLEGYDHLLDIEDEDDRSILDIASAKQEARTLGFLKSIPAFEEKRESLHRAIRSGDDSLVQQMMLESEGAGRLLAIGKSTTGRGCLHVAVLCQKIPCVEFISSKFPEALQLGDNLERTALHYAMGVESVEAISTILIKCGAERVAKDLKGRQPSYYFMNKSEILRLQEEELLLQL